MSDDDRTGYPSGYELPDEIQFCNRCVMPNTRPGLTMDEDGVCSACRHHEDRAEVDWDARRTELAALCEQYRGDGTSYDCLIAVSGGKDSWFQVETMIGLGMTPLLVSVWNFDWTETGRHNVRALQDRFDVDMETLRLPRGVASRMMREAFFRLLAPCWYWDRAVYTWPIQKAIQHKIRLVVYGEDISHQYGGPDDEEKASAMGQLRNAVVKPVDQETWYEPARVTPANFIPHQAPSEGMLRRHGIHAVYLSYFVPWSGYENMERARSHGWRALSDGGEWFREGCAEQYDQIDSPAYLVHPWLKLPKLGHQHMSDVLSCWIREGRIGRDEAVELVTAEQHKLDRRMLAPFLDFTGIDGAEFWGEIDRWANRRMLEKRNGCWRLTPGAETALRDGAVVE